MNGKGRRGAAAPSGPGGGKMQETERKAAADLVERLGRLKERLDGQGRHREAAMVARAMAEENAAPPVRTRGDLR